MIVITTDYIRQLFHMLKLHPEDMQQVVNWLALADVRVVDFQTGKFHDYKKENKMKDIKLLGLKAQDKITGFTGVITTIAYDLYGCVQAIVTPTVNKDGGKEDGRWFDVKRLTLLGKKAVMEVPAFEQVAGPANKSLPPEKP